MDKITHPVYPFSSFYERSFAMSSICRAFFSSHCATTFQQRLPFDLSLYLVANKPFFPDEDLFVAKVTQAVQGGVSCVQLRDHHSDPASSIRTAIRLKEALKGIPLFINTLHSYEVALTVGAEGVYLENNLTYAEARRRLGEKAIIGIPLRSLEKLETLENACEIDYLSVKIAASKKTSIQNNQLWGLNGLKTIRTLSLHRIVVIGGIDLTNAGSIYRELRQDDGLAMAGGLMDEEDPAIPAQKVQTIRKQSFANLPEKMPWPM